MAAQQQLQVGVPEQHVAHAHYQTHLLSPHRRRIVPAAIRRVHIRPGTHHQHFAHQNHHHLLLSCFCLCLAVSELLFLVACLCGRVCVCGRLGRDHLLVVRLYLCFWLGAAELWVFRFLHVGVSRSRRHMAGCSSRGCRCRGRGGKICRNRAAFWV
jgi:hypothetical protein